MNYYGILTNYEERMEANLEQYSRPEKAGNFHLRLDYRTWGKRMCLFCYFTDEDTGALPAGAMPKSTMHPGSALLSISPGFPLIAAGAAHWKRTPEEILTGLWRKRWIEFNVI